MKNSTVYPCVHVSSCVCFEWMYVCMCVWMWVCVCACLCKNTWMCVRFCVSLFVCKCVSAHYQPPPRAHHVKSQWMNNESPTTPMPMAAANLPGHGPDSGQQGVDKRHWQVPPFPEAELVVLHHFGYRKVPQQVVNTAKGHGEGHHRKSWVPLEHRQQGLHPSLSFLALFLSLTLTPVSSSLLPLLNPLVNNFLILPLLFFSHFLLSSRLFPHLLVLLYSLTPPLIGAMVCL